MIEVRASRAPSAEDIAAIEDLARECDRADGTRSEIDHDTTLNFHGDMPGWFCARESGDAGAAPPRLEGFLSIFAPEERSAEITAMVRPSARRSGLFTRLLAAAEEVLRAYGYRELLFLRDRDSAAGEAVLAVLAARRGAILDHREYSMLLRPGAVEAPEWGRREAPAGAEVLRASAGDLPGMAALGAAVYGDSEEESRRFLEATMAIPSRSLLVAREVAGGAVLGMVSVFAEEGIASINALAVAAERRRAGLGSLLLDEAVRLAASRGARRIGLEVDAENRGALGIYLRRGFELTAEIEYWRSALAQG